MPPAYTSLANIQEMLAVVDITIDDSDEENSSMSEALATRYILSAENYLEGLLRGIGYTDEDLPITQAAAIASLSLPLDKYICYVIYTNIRIDEEIPESVKVWFYQWESYILQVLKGNIILTRVPDLNPNKKGNKLYIGHFDHQPRDKVLADD